MHGIPFSWLFRQVHLSCFWSPPCQITKYTMLFGYFTKLTVAVCQPQIVKLSSPHCPIVKSTVTNCQVHSAMSGYLVANTMWLFCQIVKYCGLPEWVSTCQQILNFLLPHCLNCFPSLLNFCRKKSDCPDIIVFQALLRAPASLIFPSFPLFSLSLSPWWLFEAWEEPFHN